MKKYLPYTLALLLAGFGLLTLFLSSAVIFDWFGIRAKEGNYVLFVVWANFICSLLYLFAAYGFIKNRVWTVWLLVISVLLLTAAFIGLYVHANSGGIYETKTIRALLFRIFVTTAFAVLAYISITKKKL